MKELNIHDLAPGDKIVFTCQGGTSYDKSEATEMLTLSSVYTIATVDIGNWRTDIMLEGLPNGKFNSCLFSYPPA